MISLVPVGAVGGAVHRVGDRDRRGRLKAVGEGHRRGGADIAEAVSRLGDDAVGVTRGEVLRCQGEVQARRAAGLDEGLAAGGERAAVPPLPVVVFSIATETLVMVVPAPRSTRPCR